MTREKRHRREQHIDQGVQWCKQGLILVQIHLTISKYELSTKFIFVKKKKKCGVERQSAKKKIRFSGWNHPENPGSPRGGRKHLTNTFFIYKFYNENTKRLGLNPPFFWEFCWLTSNKWAVVASSGISLDCSISHLNDSFCAKAHNPDNPVLMTTLITPILFHCKGQAILYTTALLQAQHQIL